MNELSMTHRRSVVQMEVTLFDRLAVITLRVGKTEQALF